MKPPQPQIKTKTYPSGSTYWQVSCSIGGTRYRRKHSTELGARQDCTRILREYANGMTRDEYLDAERAFYELKQSENQDASNCSMLKAIQWFCKHYVDEQRVMSIKDYYHDFMEIKHAQGRRIDTIRELEKILGRFAEDFSQTDVTTMRYDEIKTWVKRNARGPRSFDRLHHMIKHFFGYLSGQSKMTPNPSPILSKSPFEGQTVTYQDDEAGDYTTITIFTAAECEALLHESQRYNAQRMFIWLLFTGMRPKESIRFWTDARWGWKLISEDLRYIRVPKSISKTRQNRIIEIHPTLQFWLQNYRQHPSFMTANWRYKYTWVRQNVLPKDKLDADVARHTMISMMIKEGKGWAEIEMQMGNKKDIQMRHYASLISSESEVDAFYGLTPEKFNHDLLESERRRQVVAQLRRQIAINREKGNAVKGQAA